MCKVFKKRMPTMRKIGEHESPCWYDRDQGSFVPDFDPPCQISQPYNTSHHQNYSFKQEIELHYNIMPNDPFGLKLPQLESPKVAQNGNALQTSTLAEDQENLNQNINLVYSNNEQAVDQLTDWRVLDKFVASQLSHEDSSGRQEIGSDYASITTPTCPIDMWK